MGKKTKEKNVFISEKSYSQIYSSLYKNEKLSDMKIKFESTGKIIPGHKAILSINSKYFENLIEKGLENNELVFPKENDEKLSSSLIEFLYKGSIEYSSESELVAFMLFANKVLKLCF
jgi:hypothetical protein